MKLFILLCLCLVATMASAQNATIAATTGLADVTKTVTGTTGAVVEYTNKYCSTSVATTELCVVVLTTEC